MISPDPITTREEAAREREKLLDFFARGMCCAVAHPGAPSEEALAKGRAVADDYLSAYEEWMVQLAARNASNPPE
ncbi:hypothetical protein GCM10027160_52030 [Streptomyces calidiresistens]|uniref:Uncharacterized protein n=1 Tax=Streptomyces calidiresistens TaxID=1485586 RepID=A0A7W3T5I6_9ACTN|nr:hypothetical protein [Streptomyces calidiresistens]MBB0231330.1 hypothetical protein [Streptomyces calidiresistens]